MQVEMPMPRIRSSNPCVVSSLYSSPDTIPLFLDSLYIPRESVSQALMLRSNEAP